jgi:hypothetical protein
MTARGAIFIAIPVPNTATSEAMTALTWTDPLHRTIAFARLKSSVAAGSRP